jgi:hypothetical protein
MRESFTASIVDEPYEEGGPSEFDKLCRSERGITKVLNYLEFLKSKVDAQTTKFDNEDFN